MRLFFAALTLCALPIGRAAEPPPTAAPACPDAQKLDETIKALAAAPETVGSLGRLRAYSTARLRFDERGAIPCAKEIAPPMSSDELDFAIGFAKTSLRIGVSSEGAGAGIAEALAAGLKDLGYAAVDVGATASGQAPAGPARDVNVRLTTRVEPTYGPPQKLIYSLAVVRIGITDGRNGKPLGQVESTFRYGAPDASMANSRAELGLAERAKTDVAAVVDKLLRGIPVS